MADQASIFTDQATDQSKTPGGSGGSDPTNDLEHLLGSIKNDRGEPKYKSVQDALKALQHSQEYIPTLKQTKDELEAKLQAAMDRVSKVETLEQTVLELTQRMAEGRDTSTPGLTEEQVANLVSQTLNKTQQEAKQKENLGLVASKVKEFFGDKAEEVFYRKAQELGLTQAEFNALAAKTPSAVLKLVGIEEKQQQRSSAKFNSDGFQKLPESMMKRNDKPVLAFADNETVKDEMSKVRALVEELHNEGRSVHDLTDPKVYFKHFK